MICLVYNITMGRAVVEGGSGTESATDILSFRYLRITLSREFNGPGSQYVGAPVSFTILIQSVAVWRNCRLTLGPSTS